MSSYHFENRILYIERRVPSCDLSKFKENLEKYKPSQAIIKTSLGISVLYLLKKFCPEIQIDSPNIKLQEQWNNLKIELPKHIDSYVPSDFQPIQVLKIFTINNESPQKDKFWQSIFWKIFKILTLDNIISVFVLFMGLGVALAYMSYSQFFDLGLELDSPLAVMLYGIKILCPMMINFILTAKSCTAFSAALKSMRDNNDFKMMGLMNLPSAQVYLHPLFVACLLSGPIMNLLALFGLIAGACATWVLQGNSAELFISIISARDPIPYLIDSELRALFASLCMGLSTCVASFYPGLSIKSMTSAISLCVTLSFMSNIAVQALMSIFFKI